MRVVHSRPRRWRSRTRKSWQSRQLSLVSWNDLRFRNATIARFVIAAASGSDSSGSSSSMKSSSDSSASSSYWCRSSRSSSRSDSCQQISHHYCYFINTTNRFWFCVQLSGSIARFVCRGLASTSLRGCHVSLHSRWFLALGWCQRFIIVIIVVDFGMSFGFGCMHNCRICRTIWHLGAFFVSRFDDEAIAVNFSLWLKVFVYLRLRHSPRFDCEQLIEQSVFRISVCKRGSHLSADAAAAGVMIRSPSRVHVLLPLSQLLRLQRLICWCLCVKITWCEIYSSVICLCHDPIQIESAFQLSSCHDQTTVGRSGWWAAIAMYAFNCW